MITVNNKDKIDWHEGMTVQDLVDRMGYVISIITVSVNGQLVQKEDYATYEIPDNAEVNVFHLAHGG